MEMRMTPLEGMDVRGKRVLARIDINSPIDPATKKIANFNRIKKSIPTLRYLIDGGAKVAVIAHQGDTLDYQNLIPLYEHAAHLSAMLDVDVAYIDDVCGPAAQERVKALKNGEAVLLGNLRYLGEELSTFEKDVKLKPSEMLDTYLVRSLAPLFDLYINDTFVHRNAPSFVAFQEVLPTAAGFLLIREYTELGALLKSPKKPCLFVLGGAKISDGFGMMKTVMKNGMADTILTTGLTGQVMLLAGGADVGLKTVEFLKSKDLMVFVSEAKEYLAEFPDKIKMPVDVAYEKDGRRAEMDVADMPGDTLYMDIGSKTVKMYGDIIAKAATIFANGPAGVYENPIFSYGTSEIWNAIANSKGYSVIGGGDTVGSATRFSDLSKYGYVSTAGGAMVNFMSGRKLPMIEAMENAYMRSRR